MHLHPDGQAQYVLEFDGAVTKERAKIRVASPQFIIKRNILHEPIGHIRNVEHDALAQ